MPKRIAVVFDSAGTLLQMYRVAKEVSTGNILENIESTAIVAQKNGCGLVVLNAESDIILGSRKDMPIFEFIKEYRVSIGISCSKGKFTPEIAYEIIRGTSPRMSDIHDVLKAVTTRCPNVFYLAAGMIVDSEARNVPYVLSTGGHVFDTTLQTVQTLHSMKVDTYIASGDSHLALTQLAEFINIPQERVFALSDTLKKEKIVLELKNKYEKVVMVGDGINDIRALRAADVGVMTTQQGDKRPKELREAADVIIDNIIKVVDVVKAL
ncbi:Cu+-exporting ATPase [Methanosarcina thermophila]|jgi:soluble P-type ATPase|uniref:Cu+-exporting ATPase n=3 Tax=Methanosarcina thermophila TaxID=2210 RepID=A0A1I6X896_METTE|nr:HAD family hydrolase [Methanosarcina thermophila]ALK04611.1 MAG: potassium ABC transporter ATPase [Methanosarcina sp. 795]AKB13279.1 Soluble P-type ATPase-like phosphatase [Methanosarcina thermophila TM-1]AKB16086.1 Soluble P-type ATPase-like phosphatase [Methanosarcina thermophila CHTI-55]NLU57237.1 HAD family hydrolase [Methanosarcina thermophila]SFT34346.1 Cu+-exporting ATPase [Methanosarcina thermophila]